MMDPRVIMGNVSVLQSFGCATVFLSEHLIKNNDISRVSIVGKQVTNITKELQQSTQI